jgi:hypothetical protein
VRIEWNTKKFFYDELYISAQLLLFNVKIILQLRPICVLSIEPGSLNILLVSLSQYQEHLKLH